MRLLKRKSIFVKFFKDFNCSSKISDSFISIEQSVQSFFFFFTNIWNIRNIYKHVSEFSWNRLLAWLNILVTLKPRDFVKPLYSFWSASGPCQIKSMERSLGLLWSSLLVHNGADCPFLPPPTPHTSPGCCVSVDWTCRRRTRTAGPPCMRRPTGGRERPAASWPSSSVTWRPGAPRWGSREPGAGSGGLGAGQGGLMCLSLCKEISNSCLWSYNNFNNCIICDWVAVSLSMD